MQAERERSASIVQVRLLGATIFSGGSPAPLSSGTHTPVTSVEIRGHADHPSQPREIAACGQRPLTD